MAMAKRRAAEELARPENRHLAQVLELYLDVKDFGAGTSLSDLSPLARRAFRVIRQASGGILGENSL